MFCYGYYCCTPRRNLSSLEGVHGGAPRGKVTAASSIPRLEIRASRSNSEGSPRGKGELAESIKELTRSGFLLFQPCDKIKAVLASRLKQKNRW